MANNPVRNRSALEDSGGHFAEAARAVVEVQLALRQRAKDLNRENHLRALQLALHADSEKVWNMEFWFW